MITLEDCVRFSGLTQEEIDAIAEHEHVGTVIACELGQSLAADCAGCRQIARYIAEDIEHARAHGELDHCRELERTLDRFVETHRLY